MPVGLLVAGPAGARQGAERIRARQGMLAARAVESIGQGVEIG
jgi:hypothetical protein